MAHARTPARKGSAASARRYTVTRDIIDPRDYRADEHLATTALPPKTANVAHDGPIRDQGEEGSCHDDETEVLTDRGWMLFADLAGGERLATVDPESATLHFERPTRLIRMPYQGKLHCARNQSLDFRVTPDHKMLVRPWNEAKRTLDAAYAQVEAKSVGWYFGLLNRVKWAGESAADTYTLPGVDHKHKPQREPLTVPMAVWLRFLGIYAAEGTMLRIDERGAHRTSYKIQVAASKPREKDFVRNLLSELGVVALELNDRFTFSNKRIYRAMEAIGLSGVKAAQKRVPEFVFWQSAEQIKDYLLGHFMGDGSLTSHVDGVGGYRAHYTGSPGLAADLQRLIFLSGNESRIVTREARTATFADGRIAIGRHAEHRVSVCEIKNLSVERRFMFEEDYDGEVFCAEVPTHHTLVTRRNGKILISGNCTAFTGHGAVQLVTGHNGSPKQLYLSERIIDRDVRQDAGSSGRTLIKALRKTGICREEMCPYDGRLRTAALTKAMASDAAKHVIDSGLRVSTVDEARAALAAGMPLAIGFSVPESFEGDAIAESGLFTMPDKSARILGGHEVCAVDYDDTSRDGDLIVRNSWGASWGMKPDGARTRGYFKMPYAMLFASRRLAMDVWALKILPAKA